MPIKPTEQQMQATKLWEQGELPTKKIIENVIDASPVLKNELASKGLITVINDD